MKGLLLEVYRPRRGSSMQQASYRPRAWARPVSTAISFGGAPLNLLGGNVGRLDDFTPAVQFFLRVHAKCFWALEVGFRTQTASLFTELIRFHDFFDFPCQLVNGFVRRSLGRIHGEPGRNQKIREAGFR